MLAPPSHYHNIEKVLLSQTHAAQVMFGFLLFSGLLTHILRGFGSVFKAEVLKPIDGDVDDAGGDDFVV